MRRVGVAGASVVAAEATFNSAAKPNATCPRVGGARIGGRTGNGFQGPQSGATAEGVFPPAGTDGLCSTRPSPTRELSTPRILGFHEVKDVQHWVSSPKREEFFGPLGVTEIKTYVDPEGSKRVGLTMNVADLEAMMGAMQTREAADAMEHGGVIPETLVILVES